MTGETDIGATPPPLKISHAHAQLAWTWEDNGPEGLTISVPFYGLNISVCAAAPLLRDDRLATVMSFPPG
jgi:hypothetical protein